MRGTHTETDIDGQRQRHRWTMTYNQKESGKNRTNQIRKDIIKSNVIVLSYSATYRRAELSALAKEKRSILKGLERTVKHMQERK